MNIILIGMMGCGKTTVAKELSLLIKGFEYVDIDEDIERSTQKKISELFLKHGEPFFRMLETDRIKLVCKSNNQIISVGGGAFEREENRRVMLDGNIVLYLKASPQEIYNRIKNETHRPLLKKNFSVEKISALLEKREINYLKANKIIDTDAKTPYDVAQEIMEILNVGNKD